MIYKLFGNRSSSHRRLKLFFVRTTKIFIFLFLFIIYSIFIGFRTISHIYKEIRKRY